MPDMDKRRTALNPKKESPSRDYGTVNPFASKRGGISRKRAMNNLNGAEDSEGDSFPNAEKKKQRFDGKSKWKNRSSYKFKYGQRRT